MSNCKLRERREAARFATSEINPANYEVFARFITAASPFALFVDEAGASSQRWKLRDLRTALSRSQEYQLPSGCINHPR
ncbi:hypothetical protein [Bradyrhizobium sacchari]|uniref:hypothetical protein n=1 Tax=Bradyrhizobium sacchari TaxID=1399419 RepID=UPI0010A9599B|nr:hypothetical protein [Bradyrhizobium sacchari]